MASAVRNATPRDRLAFQCRCRQGEVVDRLEWLSERRAVVETAYDLEAPTYDSYDPATPLHRRFVDRLIETCRPGGTLLDAACGTGPYVQSVLDAGRHVVGADQSAGMLDQARSKFPGVRFERIGLQELTFDREFDAAMCVDAMEHVPPEDWPGVLENFVRAVPPGGHVYLSLEQVDPKELDDEFAQMAAAGLPAVRGEVISGDTGGYHHYARRDHVSHWLDEAGLELVDEAEERLDAYGYRHLFLRTPIR
jgi:2-polyprenyl-3-methyl-5-hydroxy-6-metoxy-1,4-benzoquinol methylase